MDEFELVARYFAPLTRGEAGALGLIDDAAVLSIDSGQQVVVTTDTLVSGVHFLPSDPAETVAGKLLGVNLSDLAAMGAKPLAYTLSVAVPTTWGDNERDRWFEEFSSGLSARQTEIEASLIGGDTVAIPGPMCLTMTALGSVARGAELRRSAARPGDVIYVSGTIGDAVLGLKVLNGTLPKLPEEHRDSLIQRYRVPQPRIALGQKLVGLAHAVADVSDGLVADLEHICAASRLCATIDAARTPLSAAAEAAIAADPGLMKLLLTGGDDYELVFTAAPDAANPIAAISRKLRLRLTKIGRMGVEEFGDNGKRIRVIDSDGRQMAVLEGGYRHF